MAATDAPSNCTTISVVDVTVGHILWIDGVDRQVTRWSNVDGQAEVEFTNGDVVRFGFGESVARRPEWGHNHGSDGQVGGWRSKVVR